MATIAPSLYKRLATGRTAVIGLPYAWLLAFFLLPFWTSFLLRVYAWKGLLSDSEGAAKGMGRYCVSTTWAERDQCAQTASPQVSSSSLWRAVLAWLIFSRAPLANSTW